MGVDAAVPTVAQSQGTGGWRLVFATGVAPAVWGTTYLVTTEYLPPDRPLLASVIRALPAGLALTAMAGALPRGTWWWRAAVLGTLNIGAFFPLLFYAAYHLPGGVAAIVGALGPFVVAALAYPILGQVPTARILLAAAAGVGGVALLVLRSAVALDGYGLVAMVVATVAMAAGTVLGRRWGLPSVTRGTALVALTGWQLTIGGVLLVPLTLVIEGVPDAMSPRNLAGFAYLGLVNSMLAYLLWFRGVTRMAPSRASILVLLSPVVATVLGWVVLGEALTGWQLVGVVLVLGSVTIGAMSEPETRQDTVPDGSTPE